MFFFDGAADDEAVVFFLGVIGDGFVLGAQAVFSFGEEGVDIGEDAFRDVFAKIFQGFKSGISDGIVGAVADLPGGNEFGFMEFVEDLLQGEVVGVSFVQEEFGDLGVGQGKVNTGKHIKDNKFISG